MTAVPVIERKTIALSEDQVLALTRLPGHLGVAFSFWKAICTPLGLDPYTVVAKNYKFSALPLGHGKHWCWPQRVQCEKRPEDIPFTVVVRDYG